MWSQDNHFNSLLHIFEGFGKFCPVSPGHRSSLLKIRLLHGIRSLQGSPLRQSILQFFPGRLCWLCLSFLSFHHHCSWWYSIRRYWQFQRRPWLCLDRHACQLLLVGIGPPLVQFCLVSFIRPLWKLNLSDQHLGSLLCPIFLLFIFSFFKLAAVCIPHPFFFESYRAQAVFSWPAPMRFF